MQESELETKFVQYLEKLEEGVKTAAEFSAEQVPLVIQEFLAWEFWRHVVMLVFLLSLFCASVFTSKISWRISKKEEAAPAEENFFILFFVISLTASIFSMGLLLRNSIV